jgi:hypothetical protein
MRRLAQPAGYAEGLELHDARVSSRPVGPEWRLSVATDNARKVGEAMNEHNNDPGLSAGVVVSGSA